MGITHATNETFDHLVGKGVVLVDFWAPWCGPCKMIAPVLEELGVDFTGVASIIKVDVDEEGELASRFG